MRTSRKLKAAANLIRLGHEPDTVRPTVYSWAEFNRASQVFNISAMLGNLNEASWHAAKDLGGRLILSTHYGFYPALYLLLAKQTKDRRVAAIIGQQSDSHMLALQRLAASHDIGIDFIKGGPRLLREVRSYLSLNRSAVLLVDVPWSQSLSKPDLWFPGPNGQIGTLQTLHRLSQAIDRDPVHCLAHYSEGQHVLKISHDMRGQSPLSELVSMLGTAPQFYERLDSLDSYYNFDAIPDIAITFSVDLKNYVYSINDRTIWNIESPADFDLKEDSKSGILGEKKLNKLRQIIGRNLEAAIGL